MIGCSSTHSSAKFLSVPNIKDVNRIEYIYYTSGFKDGFGGNESIASDSKIPKFYDELDDAMYVSKMESNSIIDTENVVIIIHTNDAKKRVFTIYPKDNSYFLEDNDNIELYTCDKSIFESIKRDALINKKYLYPENKE